MWCPSVCSEPDRPTTACGSAPTALIRVAPRGAGRRRQTLAAGSVWAVLSTLSILPTTAVVAAPPTPSSQSAQPAAGQTAAPAVGKASIVLEQPIGGWRDSRMQNEVREEAVAYPHNLIDRGAQRGRTLIRGHLRNDPAARADKRRAPATLVVNGNPMPLYTGPEGRFVRPYAFGPGSNSVEVIDGADPSQRRRVQFYETRGDGARADMRVIVSWDDPQAEVDLHVLSPEGQHAFWAQPLMRGGGFDVDSVDGAGPEMFSVVAPRPGVWHFYVNYWGRFSEDGYHFDDAARRAPVVRVRLSIVTAENTPSERRTTRLLPLRRIGDLTWIDSLTW